MPPDVSEAPRLALTTLWGEAPFRIASAPAFVKTRFCSLWLSEPK
jgi:hypothetical protein